MLNKTSLAALAVACLGKSRPTIRKLALNGNFTEIAPSGPGALQEVPDQGLEVLVPLILRAGWPLEELHIQVSQSTILGEPTLLAPILPNRTF